MGYRIELLYNNRNENFISLGKSNNYIPYFWSVLFYKNHYEICHEHKAKCILLKIKLEKITYPKVIFSNEILSCWNNFIHNVKNYRVLGSLYLDLGDILNMDDNYTALLTEKKLYSAVNDLLKEAIVTSDINHCKYIDLLGTTTFDNLDEYKYESLKPSVPKKKLQDRKAIKILDLFFMSVVCIITILYGIYAIANGSLIMGIITILLFGLGGVCYFFINWMT